MPQTKGDLKKEADIRVENLMLTGNYQALLKCWDDQAEKVSLDWKNITSVQLYEDLGLAEINAGGVGALYYLMVELHKISQNQTEVYAYGNGYLGQKFIPAWIKILEKCASN